MDDYENEALPVGEAQVAEAMQTLQRYKAGKAALDKRLVDNELWFRMGHWKNYQNPMMEGKPQPSSGWLFNSIANKHADAMDNYPSPNVLMHYRLNFDGEGRPMLQVFNTCKHFIRTIPNLVYDESNVEDIDTRQEDHIYDECRYVLMENPISPPRHTSAPPVLDDPLELHRKAKFLRV